MNVCIFTIGGFGIGNGHIYRMNNLINQMKEADLNTFHVSFVSLNDNSLINDLVKDLFANEELLFISMSEMIFDNYSDFDLYIFDVLSNINHDFLTHLSNKNKKVLLVDYIGDFFDHDFVYLNPLYFNTLLPESVVSVEGFDFPLINKDFYNNSHVFSQRVSKICVLQGGTDPHEMIPYLLNSSFMKVFEMFFRNVQIDIFISKSSGKIEKYREIFGEFGVINVIATAENLADHFYKYDLAISSAGISIYELCASNVPTLIVTGEMKEIETAKRFHDKGYALFIGYKSFFLKIKMYFFLVLMILVPFRRKNYSLTTKKKFIYQSFHNVLRCLK